MTNGGDDVAAEPGVVHRVDFDHPAGALPPSFVAVLGDWTVTPPPEPWSEGDADPTAPRGGVLKQRGRFDGDDAPRVVLRDLAFSDVHMRVRCSMQDGLTGRACGVMLRFRDSDHYYVAYANALADDVALYRVSGRDQTLLGHASVQLSTGPWHTLEAFAEGNRLRVVWDGRDVVAASDASYARGKVGLWTKSDSITVFDDLEATELGSLAL